MCKSPPNSPIGSEISVGSPSPPVNCDNSETDNKDEYFQPLKKLKRIDNDDPKNLTDASPTITMSPSSTTTKSSKTTVDGVKSFSIADILSRDSNTSRNSSKFTRDNTITQLAHTLQQQARIVRPWDHFQHPTIASIRPLFTPALFQYEQRLAMDYHHQLHEHLRAQAQLLRQMNMDIGPSESGSDRSSSVASDCCSPEIGRSSENSGTPQKSFSQDKTKARDKSPNNNNNNTGSIYNKPLDALFQLSNKNFDEAEGGEYTLHITNKKNIRLEESEKEGKKKNWKKEAPCPVKTHTHLTLKRIHAI